MKITANASDLFTNEELFHWASTEGSLSKLQTISIDRIQSLRDKHGSTLLHYAAGEGHTSIVTYLVNYIHVHSTCTKHQRTPLHWAARNGRTEMCRYLIQQCGANVDEFGIGEVTPLQLAVWQCHLETAKVLVQEFHANPQIQNSWGCTVAHWLGKCPIYDTYIKRKQLEQDQKDPQGSQQQALPNSKRTRQSHGSVQEKNPSPLLYTTCHWLLEQQQQQQQGNSMMMGCNNHGQTPLHKAAFAGNLPVVEYFVSCRGLTDSLRDHQGNTAADCAERSQNYSTSQWLLRHASPILSELLHHLNLDVWMDFRYSGAAAAATTTTTTASISQSTSGTCNATATSTDRSKTSTIGWSPPQPPPLHIIRQAFLTLAKKYHPDRYHRTNIMNNHNMDEKWNCIHQACTLLQLWWEQPTSWNLHVRIQSRNKALAERPALLWTNDWHENEQREATTNFLSKQQQQQHVSFRIPLELQQFETNLLRLLHTQAFCMNGLSLAQLPKEYYKNWHQHPPKPKDYGCRKLIQLLERYCPNVQIRFGTEQHAIVSKRI